MPKWTTYDGTEATLPPEGPKYVYFRAMDDGIVTVTDIRET